MNVLFITHSGDFVYGAARSLKLLLNNIEGKFEYDIMFDKRILKRIPMDDIYKYAGSNCRKIMFAYYPSNFHCLDTESSLWNFKQSAYKTLRSIAGAYYNTFKAYLNKNYLNKVLSHYDLIVLNSFVLHNLLGSHTPTILYVRELASKNLRNKIMNKVNSASGIICIDKTVEKYLLLHRNFDTNIPRIVLTNPFDMSAVKEVDTREVRKQYGIKENQIVFAIAGVISASKGVDFIVEAFDKAKRNDATLLVVGKYDKNKLALELIKKYSYNNNINFIGEVLNMEEVYSITDYLLRGEDRYCTGRTVQEALYSGCSILIQGDSSHLEEFNMFPNYKQRINFYEPRNTIALMEQLNRLSKVEKNITEYSNIKEYMSKFINFAESIARKEELITK